MRHNLEALRDVVRFIYDNIQYAEFNTPLRLSLGAALHQLGYFVQPDVAQGDGGVAAEQQLVNGLPLIQGCGTLHL